MLFGLLELVDGNPPWHLDGIDGWKDSPRENRRTDPECLSGLPSGVDKADGRLGPTKSDGRVDYLHHLVAEANLDIEELRRVEGENDGFAVAYFAYRLTPLRS